MNNTFELTVACLMSENSRIINCKTASDFLSFDFFWEVENHSGDSDFD